MGLKWFFTTCFVLGTIAEISLFFYIIIPFKDNLVELIISIFLFLVAITLIKFKIYARLDKDNTSKG